MKTSNIPLIEQPNAIDEIIAMDLSVQNKAILEKFFNDGYVILDLNLENSFYEKINHDIDKIIYKNDYKTNFKEYHYNESPRIVEAWRKSDPVLDLALNKKIIDSLKIIYNRRPIPFSTINFVKGTSQPIHSDNIHFDTIPHRWLAGVWVALEDVDEFNGPLCIYPGSHKLKTYFMNDFNLPAANKYNLKEVYSKYEDGIRELIIKNNLEIKELKINKGQFIIWSANLLHGGQEIRDTSRTRKSQVIHYHFDGCDKYYNPLYSEPHLAKYKERDMAEHEILPRT